MNNAIEFRNVVKRFGQVLALDHINLTVGSSQFVALLGPSGCGKTTLLRCLAGFENPDEGEIIVGGKIVFSAEKGIVVPPGERNLGMVFQSYALWPHMKVLDNVGFGLELKKVPKAERLARVEQVLKDVGLSGLGERYPSELSGGQQQRVALARLLATHPPLFLMDEPLSNLDARLRMDMRTELKRLHRVSGVATVYVTHDQSEAMTMADLIVVMKSGEIQQASPPKELYRQPANLAVAEFVGMPRMNILNGKVVPKNQGSVIEIGNLHIPLPWIPKPKEVTIAARPEDIQLHSSSTHGTAFEVYGILPSGPETLVHLRQGDLNLYARTDHKTELELDQTVYVNLEPSAVNVFDPQSTQLLRP